MLVLTLQVFATLDSYAQAPPLRFDHLSIEDGLSSVRVWDVIQDQQGFLWVATGDGLNRYDGDSFTVFERRGSGSLSHDQVFALFEDHAGTLWVGTYGGGLNRFDAVTQTFSSYRHDPADLTSLSDDRIWTIYESPREPGILWIGTYGGGLDRFDTRAETFTHYRHDPADPASLPSNFVYALYKDAADQLWVGTRDGLAMMRGNTPARSPDATTFDLYELPVGGPQPSVLALLEDDRGNLWVGTGGAGLFRLDRTTGSYTRFRHDLYDATSLSHDHVQALMVDLTGRLWVGTYGGGVSLFDATSETFTRHRHEPYDSYSLSYDVVRALYEDRSGTVWIGTWGEGLSKVRHDKFRTYRHEPGRPNSLLPGTVSAIAEDGAGGLWVGMLEGGLTYIAEPEGNAPTYRHLPADVFAPYMTSGMGVTALWLSAVDPQVVWAGTAGGLLRLDRRTGAVEPFTPPGGPESHQIRALHASCDPGIVWVGTEQGLYRFDEVTRRFTTIDATPSIQTLYTAPQDSCRLWFTVRGGGLFEAAPSASAEEGFAVRQHSRAASLGMLPRNAFGHVWTGTSDGRLWFSGAEGDGLIGYHPTTGAITQYTEADGFPRSRIRSILADAQDRLWIGTNRGFVQFDPATASFRSYDEADGLESLVFTPWGRARGHDGTLYFGTRKGLMVVHPQHLPENRTPPPVALTDIRLEGTSLPIDPTGTTEGAVLQRHASMTEMLVLPHNVNVLTFAFAAFDFTAPQKNRYAYRMEGFDGGWRDAGVENTATYTNLDPGQYVFHVRGSNNDGVWSKEDVRLSITIRPPWYETWWAYAAYVLLALMSAISFIFVRERRLRRRAEELELVVEERTAQIARQARQLETLDEAKSRFFANLSHEFRTPLALLLGPLDDLLAGRFAVDKAAHPHLESARQNGQRLLRLINQLLELARLDAGMLTPRLAYDDLVVHLRQCLSAFASVAEMRGLLLQFTTDLPSCQHVCDVEWTETIVVNLLSNAIKFTPAGGRITLTLARDAAGAAVLSVADTGCGIAPEHLPLLFNRFYQVDDSATRGAEGTGIGLALVQQLVEAQGGTVAVESRVGQGTTFTVVLPPAEQPAPAADVPAPAAPETARPLAHASARSLVEEFTVAPAATEATIAADAPLAEDEPCVLIVEDNADLRAYIRSHLEARFRILEAGNGRQGQDLAREYVPDLIVSDVMMPEMDGFALLEALRQDRRTSHIPVVLLTARADHASRLTGFETGAEAYLTKPFNAEELTVRVTALIARQQALREQYQASTKTSTTDAPSPLPAGDAGPDLCALDEAFLLEVQALVTDRIGDVLFGVDELALAVGMSTRQLHRKLYALTGETPGGLVRRLRLEQAAHLLAAGHSVKEVADAVGFRSRPSFSRAFHKQYGTSPSEYAKHIPARSVKT